MKQAHPSEADYFQQHGEVIGFHPDNDGRAYEVTMRALQSQLTTGRFISDLTTALTEMANTYAGGRPDLLLYGGKASDFQILIKTFTSLKNKVYRLNCTWNDNYPDKPLKYDFVNSYNYMIHDKINDIFRTRLVCRYMDGPKFIALGLERFCKDKRIQYRHYPMSTDNGYYSWHCYMKLPFEVPSGDVVIQRDIWLELQITTQLTELIIGLTHGLYEDQRNHNRERATSDWKWEPNSQRFRAVYLGHTLHLLEGIIQTFRDDVLRLPNAATTEGTSQSNGDTQTNECDSNIITNATRHENNIGDSVPHIAGKEIT